MAHLDKRADHDVPPPADRPAPPDTGMGSSVERLLGGGADSISLHDPDQPFTSGGGRAAAPAGKDLGSAHDWWASPQAQAPAHDPQCTARQR